MHIDLTTQSNDLRTLFIHSPGATAGSVQMWFRAGSALETRDNQGIAHFLEHMFFKGTATRPGAKIAEEVESYGGEINAFTSFDYTCYYINTPNTHLKKTIDILLDMVSNPEFKTEDIIPERDVVHEEYRRSIDNPNQFAFSKLQDIAFTSSYAHPILGNEKTIKAFSREQLIEFRQNHYNLENSMLIVSGDLSNRDELSSLISQHSIPHGPASSFPEFHLQKNANTGAHTKDVRQAVFTLTFEAPPYLHADAASEDLAMNCLAHGESSRFYQRIVTDTSLATSLGGSTMFMVNGGAHFLRVACPEKNLPKVYAELFRLFSSAINDGLEGTEVQKIKNQYVASKIYERESIESFAFSMGHGYAQTGDIHSEEEFIQRIKASRTHDVNNGLRRMLSRSIHASLQLPKNENAKKREAELSAFTKKLSGLIRPEKRSKADRQVTQSQYDNATQVFTLKPGIRLIYRQNVMTPSFVFHAYIKGGLIDETAKTNGIHNLLSGLLTKGYDGISADTIKTALEDRSASLSGFAGKNAYGLSLHGQSEHAEELMKHFFGSLLRPDFKEGRLKHEKAVTLRHIENQKEDPARNCFQAVNNILFLDHPYALDHLGQPKTVKSISAKSISAFHRSNLKSREILFTYCGDLPLNVVTALITDPLSELAPRKSTKSKAKRMQQLRDQSVHITMPREQDHIAIVRPAFKLGASEDLYLKMLTAHLSGQSSELFVDVRDRKGLCYSVQPVHFTGLEGGYWGIYIASGHDKRDAAIEAILDLLNHMKETGLTYDEFERIKTMIQGQTQISIQTNDDYAGTYSVPELHGLGLDFVYKNNDRIQAMKPEPFNAFLKSFLNTEWNIVLVGR